LVIDESYYKEEEEEEEEEKDDLVFHHIEYLCEVYSYTFDFFIDFFLNLLKTDSLCNVLLLYFQFMIYYKHRIGVSFIQ
jgi:hypothetical protein